MLHIITPPSNDFENLYLKVREKEGRLYDLEAVKNLPVVPKSDCNAGEWKVRAASLKAFINYLDEREDVQRILEIGCGNGWFGASIASVYPEVQVVGCDMNMFELKQADQAFDYENINFLYADIFAEWPQEWAHFDMVILPSSVQYFRDFKELIERLWSFAPEIHILDSPFYEASEVKAAESRTQRYYHSLGFPKMAKTYYHHSYSELRSFDPQFLYRPPKGWRRKFARSPFPWIRLVKAT